MKAFANKLKRSKTTDRLSNNDVAAAEERVVSTPPTSSTLDQQLYQQSLAQAMPGHFAQPSMPSQSGSTQGSSCCIDLIDPVC